MKTLLFCTSYFSTPGEWDSRYARWLGHYGRVPLAHDAIFMMDDASPVRPGAAVTVLEGELPASISPGGAYLYRFSEHLGRGGVADFPGWWRGFLWSLEVAATYGFDKIVHIESDAYVLSTRVTDYLNGLSSGWTALWCPRWGYPETSMQVICADQFDNMGRARGHEDELRGHAAELVLPFTHIEKSYAGDRYGEYLESVPADADYAAQVTPAMKTWFNARPAH